MPVYAGGTTDADLYRFRRMIAESDEATYTDEDLIEVLANYPLADAAGNWPYLTSGSVNTGWVGTYDLASAAADIWDEKATLKAGNFDFTADGATFHKKQVYDNYAAQARKWRSRRAPGNHTALVYPTIPSTELWIGNLAEED